MKFEDIKIENDIIEKIILRAKTNWAQSFSISQELNDKLIEYEEYFISKGLYEGSEGKSNYNFIFKVHFLFQEEKCSL